MQTAMSHLIGTTAALGMMTILIAGAFQIGTSQRITIAKLQLQEVTDYVAKNFYDLIQTAVNFTISNSVVWKRLAIPTSIGDRGYSLSLKNIGGSLVVSARIDTEPYISVESILPLNNTRLCIQLDLNDGEDLGNLVVKTSLYSGFSVPVAWVKTTSKGIVIGLGKEKV
ncbi:MAG: hypothetical protein ACUVTL_04630 [Thermoproteota archaeon]